MNVQIIKDQPIWSEGVKLGENDVALFHEINI